MTAYYNEFDPKAAACLRELIKQGHIAPGEVDERSIADVRPDDLRGFRQCHFFAGIGVWSYALRRSGVPDDTALWTGSCPCQPFSAAGKGDGVDDERHLWPHFHHLIDQCRPDLVFGEQVASKDGLGWFDLVQADLEGSGYASGAVDLCAAGVGAPHIRQRLWWVAERLDDAAGARRLGAVREAEGTPRNEARLRLPGAGGSFDGLANCDDEGPQGRGQSGRERAAERIARPGGMAGGLADTDGRDPRPEWQQRGGEQRQQSEDDGSGFVGRIERPGPTNGLWRDADWLFCRDGKWRPVEPGTFPLAHGAPARVGRLRGYGNAIVAEAAVAFIEAYIETKNHFARS